MIARLETVYNNFVLHRTQISEVEVDGCCVKAGDHILLEPEKDGEGNCQEFLF